MESIHLYTRDPVKNPDPLEWLGKIDAVTNAPLSVIKADGMKRTLKVNLPPWGILCLQEFRWDLERRMVSPFRASRGRRIWALSRHLLDHGILVPEPVLFLEIKAFCFVTRTYIATRWLGEKENLASMALKLGPSCSRNLQGLLQHAVDMTARLHNAGFIHGDLKWSNFLYLAQEASSLMLIDLDSLKRSPSAFWQGKDFARFVLSALEYATAPEIITDLIDRYLERRAGSGWLLQRSLSWHIARKKGRYQYRRESKG